MDRTRRAVKRWLLFLEWPERCFRVTADDVRFLKKLLPPGARVSVAPDERSFLKALPRATHVITWKFKRDWYALSPALELVATPAAGRELVSADAPANVRVHFGGFHGRIISETVLAFVLAWTHGFFQVRSAPLWPRTALADRVTRDLAGSRAVLLGYGRIGRAIAERLETFGVSVFGYARHLKISPRTLDRALAQADWLIAALPSDTGTDNLVDATLLAKLPPRAVFVNVGRGNCVDEAALLTALRAHRLAGAYLDVYKNEPTVLAKASVKPKPGETDLARLSDAECPWNLIRMPHASAYTPSYLRSAFQELKDEGLV